MHGANAHLALTEDHSFAVEDAVGRSWICYPIKREEVESLAMLDDLVEIDETDRKVGESTEVRLVFCENENELRQKLAGEQSK